MSNETIKKQALELSEEERAELAHLLIDSLNPEAEYESEKAWSKELKKRMDQFEQGASSTKPWSEVKKNALDLLNK
jgi:putative addiction module component (TIGR02574 family)